MRISARLAVIVSLLAFAGVVGPGVSGLARAQPAQAVCEGNLVCLDQGWSDAQRRWWYTASQGSRLLPLSWMLALESAGSSAAPEKFLSAANIKRWGYLANPASSENPDGLPLGFAVDEDSTSASDIMCETFPASCAGRVMRQPWVGLNCAACHTSDIEFAGKTFRVEGTSSLADFQTFGGDLLLALVKTLEQPQTFQRFANAVLGHQASQEMQDALKAQLAEQVAWRRKLAEADHGDVRYGHGRIDAQGHILHRIALSTRVADQIADIRADAPASVPFIWNTEQQNRLQWNGIADLERPAFDFGIIPDFFGLTTTIAMKVGALIRNTSEVMGVFAHFETHNKKARDGYRTSLRIRNMIALERLLRKLKSPQWPENILGPIDRPMAERGKAVFERLECQSCHAPLAWDDLSTQVDVSMTPLPEIGTDLFLACNTFFHRSKAGNFEGQRVFVLRGDRIASEDLTRNMLINSAAGALVGEFNNFDLELFDETARTGRGRGRASTPEEVLPGVTDEAKTRLAEKCLDTDDALLAYKARPLNGVWATAPYLHNGSVPTLYDLLLPAKLQLTQSDAVSAPPDSGEFRPEIFGVGSAQFDPIKVGFVTDPAANPTTFQVRDAATGEPIPGNYNSGHDYGTTLTEQERLELVEYLKTL